MIRRRAIGMFVRSIRTKRFKRLGQMIFIILPPFLFLFYGLGANNTITYLVLFYKGVVVFRL